MLRRFLKSKIRDIRLTGTYLEYEGSITLDDDYLEAAGIAPRAFPDEKENRPREGPHGRFS